ncbi:IQ domain-containing protein M isoform X2 [Erinaceus europaeus]|uniref:IQ domain-containing protein M isoform X2 n=1 Tax=Erinaceus europaeus TaxID=9365 RepID=A0ABM3WEF3_ERIEU|nr:IQ domain-containing protein M isoform X2 [Erinaceus europaeus]
MAAAETVPENSECPVLEMPKQDFFQEAKALIAQHEKMNEYKFKGPSINVFKNKHQKPKSGKFLPLDTKNKETLDVLQELQMTHQSICPSKDLSKREQFKERPQPTFKVPPICIIKEKCQQLEDISGQMRLGKLVADIEAVSKNIEEEERIHHYEKFRSRVLDAYPNKLNLPLKSMTSFSVWNLIGSANKVYDWRGAVSINSELASVASRLSFSETSSVFADYSVKSILKKKLPIKQEQKPHQRTKSILCKVDKSDNKVSRIGPHIEIFQVFQKKEKFKANIKTVRMIIAVQAFVRGWLERKRLQRLTAKALYHGPNLKSVVNMYRRLIHRIKYRLDLTRTRTIIKYSELEEWMDRKKFYETMFSKREDWQGLERSELLKYFNDCGHFPVQQQIDDVWNRVHIHYRERCSDLVTKPNAIEMLFTLYPPQGAHVSDNTGRLRSTWLRPIVDGEEAYKYIVSGHPILKRADIRIVGKLVTKSIRERKLRQHYLMRDQE